MQQCNTFIIYTVYSYIVTVLLQYGLWKLRLSRSSVRCSYNLFIVLVSYQLIFDNKPVFIIIIIYYYLFIETDYKTSLSRVESLSEAKRRMKFATN